MTKFSVACIQFHILSESEKIVVLIKDLPEHTWVKLQMQSFDFHFVLNVDTPLYAYTNNLAKPV